MKTFEVKLSAQQLMAEARERTSINIVDSSIEEALTRLLQALNTEAQLTSAGADAWEHRLLRLLCNRLRMQRDFEAHPEINDQQVVRPIILLGGARTGTTKLHKMLAASGDFLYLPFWQGHELSLRTGDRKENPAPRIKDSDHYIRWFNQSAPKAKFTHGYGLFEPEEEIIVHEHAISCGFVLTLAIVPTFLQWWITQDFRKEYEFIKQALKYLQWQFHDGDPRPWVLKCPIYLGFEPWLKEVFSDATLITTNRNVTTALSSTLSTIYNYHKAYSDADRREFIGQMMLEGRYAILEQHMNNRDSHPDLNILDIAYSEVTKNAEHAIERIYSHAGMSLSKSARQRLRNWEKDNQQHKVGVHEYSLEEYSLTEEIVNNKFKPYIECFRDRF
jgi:Sulfotransferase family